MTPKQFNNTTERVFDDLKETLQPGAKLSIAAASFSIYAFEALKTELEKIDSLRFIFTSPTFNKEKTDKQKREFYIPKLGRERTLFGSDFEIRLRNELTQKAVARECAEWIKRKAKFKSNITNGKMNSFLNVAGNGSTCTYMPFNEFTTTELGLDRGDNICPMIVGLQDTPATDTFLKNFNELWQDREQFSDVTETILDNIENVYKENSPDFIYFVTLYNIFNEFLEDVSEDVLPNEATGFKNSEIWGRLYNFQRDAVLAIINKLEKYNGCILADSVGLGKTFTALAVIKYYENRNKTVLVLCPKKLNDNWQTFRANYKNNPVAKDRLNYDVLFHSDLSRDHGLSNGLDLDRINWSNYDLIVIDESHNFRNGGKFESENGEEFKENRYAKLMNKVIRQGVKTKVLMLSATPVNNRFLDLKNQLQLAYEGDADNIDSVLDTERSIEQIFREAQKAYTKWTKLEEEERTTQRLLDSLSFDFFQLLDAVTIARSRKHIVKYYDTTDIGQFPKRLKPISRRPELATPDLDINFRKISSMVESLNLLIYAPSLFILDSRLYRYKIKINSSGISVHGREAGMRKLMAINMLKRLESSVHSFKLTIERLAKLMSDTITAIDKFGLRHSDGDIDVVDMLDTEELDGEDSEVNPFADRNTKVDLNDMDYLTWRKFIESDLKTIQEILNLLILITPDKDAKLQQLVSDLKDKFENPINGNNKKVIIFTAFADTANYLYDNLAQRILEECGLNSALITGNINGKCTLKGYKCSYNGLLTLFSPISKEREALDPNETRDIDILIATDCISEGQNLQDCDFLINYDIHWNPVRIIQRFGRIDRIGSKNEVIQLVNYWPNMELDDYIKLKGRVESRMKATILTATGDDNIIADKEDQDGDLEYRRKQLKKLQTEVVDLEEMDTCINIMDLGLNEFRLDLLAYMKQKNDIEHTPNGMSAVAKSDEMCQSGVIFVLKNIRNEVNIGQSNLLHPFYMVYIDNDGTVVCNHLSPKKLLDNMRHLCRGNSEPFKELCEEVKKETKDGKDMKKYSKLLQDAISSLIVAKEEEDVASLFSDGETTALEGDIQGLDDFELITFLIIK